jgi:hypothetical protein
LANSGDFPEKITLMLFSSEKWVETSSFSDSGGRLYMGWVDAFNPHSAGSSRDKIVFLTGRAKKRKNMFVFGGQINDSFLL